ncbi:MAG TPA: LuxR C-terminal-related transcriptional regulator [Aldersonia sp.]
MSASSPLLRPRDSDALRAEVRRIAVETGAPVVFAGEVGDENFLLLSEFAGTWTTALRGLIVRPDSGVGGQAVAARRPTQVADYARSRLITHHYDGPVVSEGIKSVLGVPVVVAGTTRAVLYAADRGTGLLGDRTTDQVVRASRRLATEIAIRDEVDRRLQLQTALLANGASAEGASTEEIRDIHAQLRALAAGLGDVAVRDQLLGLGNRLARLVSGQDETEPPELSDATLSPRELDVLATVALGCSNAEVARRLSVKPETVKSYLRTAMSKLGAHSRHEAVVTARRFGLLP